MTQYQEYPENLVSQPDNLSQDKPKRNNKKIIIIAAIIILIIVATVFLISNWQNSQSNTKDFGEKSDPLSSQNESEEMDLTENGICDQGENCRDNPKECLCQSGYLCNKIAKSCEPDKTIPLEEAVSKSDENSSELRVIILSPLANEIYNSGQNVTFSAEISGGNSPYNISWWEDIYDLAGTHEVILGNSSRFVLNDLSGGQHDISIKVRDYRNNKAVSTVQIWISKDRSGKNGKASGIITSPPTRSSYSVGEVVYLSAILVI